MRTKPGDRLSDNVDHSRLIDIVSKVKLGPETLKNRSNAALRRAQFDFFFHSLGEIGVKVVLVEKEGSFYVFFDIVGQ